MTTNIDLRGLQAATRRLAHIAFRLGVCGLAITLSTAHAEDSEARAKMALQRAQQALQQAQADNEQLQSSQAALTAEKATLDAANTKLTAQVKSLSSAKAQARAAQAQVTQLQTQLASLQQQLNQLKEHDQTVSAQLAETRSRLHSVVGLLETTTRQNNLLQTRNQALYATGRAAIDMYRSKQPGQTWSQQVSLLGFDEVHVENAAEAMRTRLEQSRFVAPPPPAAPASAPSGAPSVVAPTSAGSAP